MYSKVYSAAIQGMEGRLVTVEADMGDGLPSFDMVGALSTEVKEAASRVRTALKNAGYRLPPKRIVINLAPADVRKDGTLFDLPVAVAVLAAMEVIPAENLEGMLLAGELGLGGELRPVAGVMALAACAQESGLNEMLVPEGNVQEGAVNQKIRVCGASHLNEVVRLLKEPDMRKAAHVDLSSCMEDSYSGMDFKDIRGQETAKRAAEIAAAGMHNLLLLGPPGVGKTLIARCIPGILPRLTLAESLEISRINSICGLMPEGTALLMERPFRAPHHTVTPAALTGGGRVPRPGELSLASHGVLFLDELPEMSRASLEALRQPLEEKRVVISRLYGSYEFPAKFMLVAAMNPCPCGCFPDRNKCRCSIPQIQRYLGKLSRPLMDRIDISVTVDRLPFRELQEKNGYAEASCSIRERVEKARLAQKERFEGTDILYNSSIPGGRILEYCPLGEREEAFMKKAFDTMEMSARAYHRVLRVARTIADLEGAVIIEKKHLKEAILYRVPSLQIM
ncbi:YifB family Mg chelatase-like AAA ATPase [Qiania dongpingensis]|uniref:YifB family Mg chelatase-like AAA ATPase n=1 Tax=Qiania dongpingensis TaxID=2763669 RepID=A0A7G9G5R7_9FIRM|nr:YifB family Mg chelatase-like AAA ATPase [Qiania dongpingensis]QNM06149.1 YifB family Mg chelatase-like AAA ATPase [Qiania dongpingensis]